MELYIEYVIIDNLVVDYILIKFIERTMGIKVAQRRLGLFLICGVVSAIILPWMSRFGLVLTIYRLGVSIIMTFCIKKYKKISLFFGYLAVLWAYTFFIGGVILGVLNLFNISYSSNSIILYQADIPVGVLGAGVIVLVVVMKKVLKFIKTKVRASNYIYDIEIQDNNNTIKTQGFFDSGNSVSYQGNGVNIFSIGLFVKLYKNINICTLLASDWQKLDLKDVQTLEIAGVGNSEKFLSFKVDKISVCGKVYYNSRCVLVMKNFENYECVLHSDFVEGV